MNKVFLRGNVGSDPKIMTFQDGGKNASFTLATTERGYTTKDGRKVDDITDWHNVVVKHPGLAGVVEQYVHKGTPLLIEGKIRTRKWTGKDGVERYITEIIADEMEMLGGRAAPQGGESPSPTPVGVTPYVSGGGTSEDLPF